MPINTEVGSGSRQCVAPLIEVVNVSKRFRLRRETQRSIQDAFVHLWRRRRSEADYFWPLRNLSFQVCPGDSIGVLGQNGSGKSTLLKVITGVLPPTSGRVHINGRVASLLELGAGFHPDLTGRENVFLNGSIYGMSSATIHRKLDRIIDFAEIGNFIDTPVKHYSSGMYVRLAFSVAIHTEPEVLIVDEVLTVGDQIFQQKCMQRIWEMKSSGVAIILVSHNLEDIRRLCSHAIWLQDGAVRAEGSSLDVVDDYLAYTNELYYSNRRAEQAVVPEDAQPAAETGNRRWGTRQAEITHVELSDEQGQPSEQFRQGGSMIVRIHYVSPERITRPCFGLAIYRHDGAHVNGPNSVDEGYHLESIEGTGVMEYRIEQLPLNPGQYELTVAIYNHNSTVAFDHHHRAYRFYVKQSGGKGEEGVVHIAATWQHVPAEVISFHTKTA